METIMGVFIAVLSGVNIFQFVFWRQTKARFETEVRQMQSEVAKTDVEIKQEEFNLKKQQYDYAIERFENLQKQFYEMAEAYRNEIMTNRKDLDAINEELCNLKNQVSKLQAIKCYKINCAKRQLEPNYKHCNDGSNKTTQS